MALTGNVNGTGQWNIGLSNGTEEGAVVHQPGDTVVHYDLPQVLVVQDVCIDEGPWRQKKHIHMSPFAKSLVKLTQQHRNLTFSHLQKKKKKNHSNIYCVLSTQQSFLKNSFRFTKDANIVPCFHERLLYDISRSTGPYRQHHRWVPGSSRTASDFVPHPIPAHKLTYTHTIIL